VGLHLVAEPSTPAEQLEQLLRANHADGTGPAGAACEGPGAGGDRRGLVPQNDGWACDPAWDGHGLSWWYPHLIDLIRVRTTSGRGGAGGSLAVPIDLTALDFIAGKYWSADEPPTEDTVDDPDNYRLGFVPTVIELEKSARRALRLQPRPRPRAEGYDGVSEDQRVVAALEWLAVHAQQLVDEAPMFADTVRAEALRLIGRASALVIGNRFDATVNVCMYCEQETVVADEDRAVCRNPQCRRPDGTRRCWRYQEIVYLDGTHSGTYGWVEVDEPDVRGRGRLTDEQLSRWTRSLDDDVAETG
jgi:hypothetical protein